MTRVKLYFKPADDETRIFQYLDSSGAVVSLSGYTAAFTATVAGTTVTGSCSVDGPNGKVTATVSSANTHSLGVAGNSGYFEVKVTSAGGLVTTIAEGPLVLLTPKD